jgi:AcrR family transcriptional regulator
MASNPRRTRDRRVIKSRQKLLDAFFTLVLREPYDDITVGDIVARAGVGRSTFYEHFAGKDGLLAASLARPFGMLADTVQERDNTQGLVAILEHFWDNRRFVPGVFTGPTRRHSVAVLVRLIELRLRAAPAARRASLLIPAHLAAIQLAEALFAPITAWATGQTACPPARLAVALRKTTQALTETLHGGVAARSRRD